MQDVLVHVQHHPQYLNFYLQTFLHVVFLEVGAVKSSICAQIIIREFVLQKSCYRYDAGNVTPKLITEFFLVIFHSFPFSWK